MEKDEAFQQLAQFVKQEYEKGEGDPSLFASLGYAFWSSEIDDQLSVKLYEHAIKLSPQKSYFQSIFKMHTEKKRHEKAFATLEQWFAWDPGYEDIYISAAGMDNQGTINEQKVKDLCLKGIDACENLLKENKKNREITGALSTVIARIHLILFNGEAALAWYQKANGRAKGKQEFIAQMLNYGTKLFKLNDNKRALDYVLFAEKIAPKDYGVCQSLEYGYSELGETEKSLEYGRKMLAYGKTKKQKAYAWFAIGCSYQKQQKYAEEKKAYEKALRFDPTHANAIHNLGVNLEVRQKDPEAAFKYYQKALLVNKNDPDTLHAIGLYYEKKKNYEKAIDYFQQTVDSDPYYAEAFNELAYSFSMLKKGKESLDAAQRGLLIAPEKKWLNARAGYACKLLKKYEKAIEYYKRELEVNPSNSYAYSNLGEICAARKRYDEAIRILTTGVAKSDAPANCWFSLGYIYFENLKEPKKALDCCMEGLKVNEKNSKIWYLLGEIYAKEKKYAEAAQAFRKTAELDPTHSCNWGQAAEMYMNLGDFKRAGPLIKKSLAISRSCDSDLFQMGRWYVHNKKYGQAQAILRELARNSFWQKHRQLEEMIKKKASLYQMRQENSH